MNTARECSALRFAENPFCSTLNSVIFLTILIFVALLGGVLIYLLHINHTAEIQNLQEDRPQPSSQSLYPTSHQSYQFTPHTSPALEREPSPPWQWVLGSRQHRPLTSATPLFPSRTEMQSPMALSSSLDTKKVHTGLSSRNQHRGRSRTPRRLAMTTYGTVDGIRTTEVNEVRSTPPTTIQSPSQGTIAQRRASPTGVFIMDEDLTP